MAAVIIILFAVFFLPPAMARSKGGGKGGGEDINRCVSDPAGCAGRLGVDHSLLTFVELKGKVSGEAGKGFGETAVKVGWDSSLAPEECRQVIETLLAGQSFTTSAGGEYSIFVPACGSITYTLTPDNPEFSWTPASRSVRVSGASPGVAYKSGGSGGKEASTGGKAAAADSGGLVDSAIEGTPDSDEVANVNMGELTVEGRDYDSLSGEEDESKGPLRGTPAPGYAELERNAIDALWRATTGCDSLGDPLAGPSAMELAACADKPVSQRMQTAEQGRNDFNNIFGIGGSTSSGLASRAAGDRGLPTLTTDSDGNPVLPTKEEIQAWLRGLQNEYSDDPNSNNSDVPTTAGGITPKKAGETIKTIGKATEWVGRIYSKVGVGLKEAGEAIQGINWKNVGEWARGYDIFRKVDSINTEGGDNKSPDDTTPNPDEDQPYQYSAKECEAICSGTSASNTQRQQCGCDDPSEGVKNPSGTDNGTGTQSISEVDGMNMMKKKLDPLIHTTEPEIEEAPVEINDLPDNGGKGPRPDPAKGKTK